MSDVPTSVPNEREVLLATLDLPSGERVAYLDQACHGDPKLKARIQHLLEHVEQSGSFMAAPAIHLDATTPMDSVDIGCQIDRYKLMEQIGEGGMGVVFVAEQTEPVRRKVALKVIKPGMDSKAVVARFEAERQALALMDHPNIARVLDAGTTPERLPYFVMELVRGLSITKYCDRAKASIEERLRLFIDVCSAVQHAHQKGIIHRDLKPSNILVTLHDGKPVVKVIDFGVAKALHQQLTQHTIYTALNQVVGTPLYMSPEQLELSGLDIDTRTDVYSLGVLLYELLSGTTPFDRDRLLKSGFDEMRRIIREEDPPRPSYRVTTMPQAVLSTVAEKRGIDQRTFQRSIESELDWIVLKALEKDRNRRYVSASDFGADVNRFLLHEIVQACPPSWGYFLQKTLRKHRVAFATVSLVLLTLLIGLVATTWQWRRALVAESETFAANQLANERAGLANRRLQIAEDTIEVMYTEFAQEWLGSQSGTSQRQAEFLKKAVASFEQLAKEMPSDEQPRAAAIRANLRAGQLLKQLGDYDAALLKLSTAEEMASRATQVSPDAIEVLLLLTQTRVELATIHRNRGNHALNNACADEALSLLKKLMARVNSTADQKAEIAKGLSNCALCYTSEKSRMDEAVFAAVESVQLARELHTDDPENVALIKLLANCLSARGQQTLWWGKDNEACESAYAECIALKKKIVAMAPDRIDVLQSLPSTLQNYGVVLGRLDRKEEADANLVERLKLLRELVLRFPDRPEIASQLGEALRVVGNKEHRADRIPEAWQYWNECEILLEGLVSKYPDIRSARRSLALSLHQFSGILKKEGNIDQARNMLVKCNKHLANFVEQFPDDTEMYVIYQKTLRDMAIMDLLQEHHEKAFDSAQAILNYELVGTAREKTTNSEVQDFQDHIGHILGCLIPEMIAARCHQIGQEASVPGDVLVRYRDFQVRCQSLCKGFLAEWNTQRTNSSKEWEELLNRIDAKDAWQAHHRPPSLEYFFEDALLATRVLALRDFIRTISQVAKLPEFWSDVALVAVSAPEFCGPVEELTEFCKLGYAQSDLHPNARRALAWLSYRQGQFEKCLAELDAIGHQPDDAFVRAMTLKKLGRDDEAIKSLEVANRFLTENEALLTKSWNNKPIRVQPNLETYRRLKAEAEHLIF